MNITTIIKSICPDLYENADRAIFINLATEQLNSEHYLTNYNLAIALLASHIFTLSNRGSGISGNITTVREGDISISYANISTNDKNSDWNQTSYGIQLKNLTNRKSTGIFIQGK